jgi:rfaE bifunctional protein kinase chain/domain
MNPGFRARFGIAASTLRSLLSGMPSRRVLVYGDIVCDEYVHTRIERTSREAPVLILRWSGRELRAGGAANSARNVAALGARAVVVGVVGADEAGGEIRRIFRGDRIGMRGLLAVPGYATPRKTRILAGLTHRARQQVVRVDSWESLRSGRHLEEDLHAALRRGLRGVHGVLVSDYAIGAVRPTLAHDLFARAARAGIPVVLDSRHQLGELPGATVATPSEAEAEEILGAPLPAEDSELERVTRALLDALKARAVLLTRGSRGMLLLERERPPYRIPVFGADEVTDVTGAGDTVASVLAVALASGVPLRPAALLANVAAGLVVMKLGTATVSREEIAAALEDRA